MGCSHGEKLQSSRKASGGRQKLLEVGQPQTLPSVPFQPPPSHLELRERGRASCLLLGMVRGGLHVSQAPSETRRAQGHLRPPLHLLLQGRSPWKRTLNPSFKQALLCKSLDAADCQCKLQREKVFTVPGLPWDTTAKSANPTAHRGPSCRALRARHQHGKEKSYPWKLHPAGLVHSVGRGEGFLRSIKKKGASCCLLKPPPA